MNPFLIFLFGMGAGTILTFCTIMLFAQQMEKNQKKLAIKLGKDKFKPKC